MSEAAFTADDLEDLTGFIVTNNQTAVLDWVVRLITDRRAMAHLLFCLTDLIGRFAPRGLTKGVEVAEDEMWALYSPSPSSRPSMMSAQLLTATLNGDRDTVTALVYAVLDLPEEEQGELTWLVLRLYSDVLHAMMLPAQARGGDLS